jgi:hypothetical protein
LDDLYDIGEQKWRSLIDHRFGGYVYDLPSGECRDAFAERILVAVESGAQLEGLPLFLEDCGDRRDVIENDVLGRCSDLERRYLKSHPEHLGLRCESFLSGHPVEELLDYDTVPAWQRKRLGELAFEALLGAVPAI